MPSLEPVERAETAGVFDSADALDAYLDGVRTRLETRQNQRKMRAFWEQSLQKVGDALAEAQAAHDTEIAAELEAVAGGFRARLADAPPPLALPALTAPVLTEPVAAVVEVDTPASAPEIVPVPEPRPVPDETPEEKARKSQLLAQLQAEAIEAERAWQRMEAEGFAYPSRQWNRTQCFHLRSLACVLGNINARAQTHDLTAPVRPGLQAVRDRMAFAREAIGERGECPLLDDGFWYAEAQISAEAWSELSRRYLFMADAQSAWEWYDQSDADLPSAAECNLLNAIVGIQQGLYRRIEAVTGGHDRLQGELYLNLKDAAKRCGYLWAMNSDVSLQELDTLGADLMRVWQNARDADADFWDGKAKEAAKTAALAAFTDFVDTQPELGKNPVRVTMEQAELFPLIDACLSCGVPPSNITLRNALLHAAPFLLYGKPKYAKIYEAVQNERRRKNLSDGTCDNAAAETANESIADIEDTDEGLLTEAEVKTYQASVIPWLKEKRVLILGGVPRQRICDELKILTECVDIAWPNSKKADKVAKFQTEIKKADVLLLLKNFASHEMSDKGREWVGGDGSGHFIYLPSGYGVKQILYQLHQYVVSKNNHL